MDYKLYIDKEMSATQFVHDATKDIGELGRRAVHADRSAYRGDKTSQQADELIQLLGQAIYDISLLGNSRALEVVDQLEGARENVIPEDAPSLSSEVLSPFFRTQTTSQ